MKIKVSAVLNIDENVYGTEESEMEWFREMIADKENTMLILHSNDVGDTIGETFDFDWKILNDEQQLPQQETLYTREQVIAIVEKSRATGLTAEYIIQSLKQHKK